MHLLLVQVLACCAARVADDPARVQSAADALATMESACSRLQSEFLVREHGWARIQPDDDWNTSTWKELAVTGSSSVTWAFRDGLLRIEERAISVGQLTTDAARPVDRVSVWTGDGWFRRRNEDPFAAGHEDVVGIYRIQRQPRLLGAEKTYAMFNGCIDWPSFVTFLPLGDTLLGYPAREVRSDDKSLVLQFDRNESVSVECHFDLMPAPRLRRIESESRGRDGTSFAGLVMNRHVFEIDEWQVFEDIGAIPARAWFFSAAVRHPSLPPEQPVSVSVVELIRMSATALPDVDEFDRWFDPPLAELGFLVYDERSNLSYVIGRDRIAVDGRLFQLAEPIAGLIDGRLPDYLGEAAREISGSIPAVLQKAEEEDDG